jgi:hypothetical protein
MDEEIKTEEQLTCDECGRFGIVDFGEKKLCVDCYGTSGSCCPGFGREEETDED